ncbi:hypothetical protein FQA39_LY00376 [Lamprigera yunnana]|nr:hypothetical protein FQA39_LY00376 [Lamprigera yunnana]
MDSYFIPHQRITLASAAIADIYEEYKLSIINATISLFKSLTYNVKTLLYTRENGLCLCQILHVAVEMVKSEKLRSLRLACIDCIMLLAQVQDNEFSNDIAFKKQVADIFMFFAPGVISSLASVAVDDDKCGHKIILMALRAWGRIVALQLYNYEPAVLNSFTNSLLENRSKVKQELYNNTREGFHQYFKNSKMDLRWYKQSDEKLQNIMVQITKLSWNSHASVRLELATSCSLLMNYCAVTIPITVSKATEILLILSEDDDKNVSNTSKVELTMFCDKLSGIAFKSLLENLEERFFASLTSIPRIFNSFDVNQQLSSLNLVIGFLRLFGANLEHVLKCASHSSRLLETLLHISEFDRKYIRLFEEYSIEDFCSLANPQTPWKNFKYFQNEIVQRKIEVACNILAEFNTADEVIDLLINVFLGNQDKRKESTYILNNLLAGIPEESILANSRLFRDVLYMYIEPQYWKIPLEVSYKFHYSQMQNNVIQICLQIEGISTIAVKLKHNFRPFLSRILYPLLEHAGSVNPLLKTAGGNAIVKISEACGYKSITTFISSNCDYYSFHVVNKIHRAEENLGALKVLSAVMKFGDESILPSISNVIQEVLSQTYHKYFQEDCTVYLQLFKIFVESLKRLIPPKVIIMEFKTRKEKEEEYEHFQISNIDKNCDFYSDGDEKKTVEEMYKEDMEKLNIDDVSLNDDGPVEIEKPPLPHHVKLISLVLQRALNFLPFKDKTRKLLVLDILIDGLPFLSEWEDELLPVVHQIWSPLVERFKETDDSLIVSRSFDLLVLLANLSKDFIRLRTVKEVLPLLLTSLEDLADHSYLKDHGDAYRYTHAYKLQLNMLQSLSNLVLSIDMENSDIEKVMRIALYYFSNKQPLPLQTAAKQFCYHLKLYDSEFTAATLCAFMKEKEYIENIKEYEANVKLLLE